MDRRAFIGVAVLGIVVSPSPARAQPARRVYRVGILRPTLPPLADQRTSVPSIAEALRELGYVEGRNLVLEARYADDHLDRLPALARELVQLRMDVIVAVAAVAVRAVKDATTTIPIVMWGNFDPVAAGFIPNLARPGGNITGVLIAPDGTLAGKKLEFLKEAVPGTKRIAFLGLENPGVQPQLQEVQKAASSLGIELLVVIVNHRDYEGAFATIAAAKPGALFVAASSAFVRDQKQIIALAAKYRLPAIYEWPEQVADGGLMSYGARQPELIRRVAAYVDRILKGANPGDLSIEQPTKLELAINLRTARALGLAIPPSLLLRADEVIQ